jgi:predicted SAM-dependent methyltransferase
LRYFQKDSVDRILGERVWEHLTLEDGEFAAATCFSFLKKGVDYVLLFPMVSILMKTTLNL